MRVHIYYTLTLLASECIHACDAAEIRSSLHIILLHTLNSYVSHVPTYTHVHLFICLSASVCTDTYCTRAQTTERTCAHYYYYDTSVVYYLYYTALQPLGTPNYSVIACAYDMITAGQSPKCVCMHRSASRARGDEELLVPSFCCRRIDRMRARASEKCAAVLQCMLEPL